MKKLNYSAKADSSLDKISSDVSAIVRKNLRDEMNERIRENPKNTVVDYSEGNAVYKKDTGSSYDPYNMYSHIDDQGRVTGKRTTDTREDLVTEIYKDGTKTTSTKEDFEKKIMATKPTEKEIDELKYVVRVTSKTPDAYKNAEVRSIEAYKKFDKDKYLIEETAARVGIPASLLASVYFKYTVDDGSINAAPINEKHSRLAYYRLYETAPGMSADALNYYLSTPEGKLDFIAIGLKSESKFFGYDIYNLSNKEMHELLTSYGKYHGHAQYFDDSVVAYNDIFENIYSKLPPKEKHVKFIY